MKFEYKIKGVTLDINDLINIHDFYEAACTAEYLMDNYNIGDEDEAMQLGYEVRRLMDKYGYNEEEAIDGALAERDADNNYTPSAESGDYSPSNPWDAPGMKMSDFI